MRRRIQKNVGTVALATALMACSSTTVTKNENTGGSGNGGSVSTGGSETIMGGSSNVGGGSYAGNGGSNTISNGGKAGEGQIVAECAIEAGEYGSVVFSADIPKDVGGIQFTITAISADSLTVSAVCGSDSVEIEVPTDGTAAEASLRSGENISVTRLSNSDSAARLTIVIE